MCTCWSVKQCIFSFSQTVQRRCRFCWISAQTSSSGVSNNVCECPSVYKNTIHSVWIEGLTCMFFFDDGCHCRMEQVESEMQSLAPTLRAHICHLIELHNFLGFRSGALHNYTVLISRWRVGFQSSGGFIERVSDDLRYLCWLAGFEVWWTCLFKANAGLGSLHYWTSALAKPQTGRPLKRIRLLWFHLLVISFSLLF